MHLVLLYRTSCLFAVMGGKGKRRDGEVTAVAIEKGASPFAPEKLCDRGLDVRKIASYGLSVIVLETVLKLVVLTRGQVRGHFSSS